MRILGIDPGVAIVGFGLIETERSAVRMLQYGAINTSAGLPLATRLVQIEQDLTQLIRQFQPDEIAIEELFSARTSPPASPWPTGEASSSARRRRWASPSTSTRPCR